MANPILDLPAYVHPWSTLFELACRTKDPTSWRLGGGLMVQVHAMLHSMDARPTTDADLLVDVLTHAHAVREVSGSLSRLGFSVQVSTLSGYTTRMRNGDFEVDLLVDNPQQATEGEGPAERASHARNARVEKGSDEKRACRSAIWGKMCHHVHS